MSFSSQIKEELEKKVHRDPGREALRRAFLDCGTIGDPHKAWHLEFDAAGEKEAGEIRKALAAYGITAHQSLRKGKPLVYVKESEAIAEFLNVAGAHQSMMEFENLRIEKGLRGDVNRRVNCDTANINKSLAAAERQIEDIIFLKNAEAIPKELEEFAQLRLENPELSLTELGEMLDPPLGKSGVNHRLRKLSALASELRKD